MTVTINADQMHYRALNEQIKEGWQNQNRSVLIQNVNGHRYIGDALQGAGSISIEGVPGNDLAVFMDGPHIEVHGNIQDAAANTMNSGSIVVHGSAGDTLGYGMRGGLVYIRDNVGYRAGIHMKEYGVHKPVLVIGGTAGDFLGEYMAGGAVLILNLDDCEKAVGDYCGSGMHGGVLYIRGVKAGQSFKGAKVSAPDEEDKQFIAEHLMKFQDYFKKGEKITAEDFMKLTAAHLRPYENHYIGV